MPNWAEGSLKLRGKSENIASALKEMLLNDTVTLEDEYDGTLLKFNNKAPYFYINRTRGEIIKNICYKYDDYQWEVPFGNLGG